MTSELLLWLLVFFFQTSLVGVTMYTLICLTDLESDYINPHDAAERINKYAFPEVILTAAVAALIIWSRNFLFIPLPTILCAWVLWEYHTKSIYVDVTEIFRDCKKAKRRRMFKLAAHILLFVVGIFKLVTTIVDGMLSTGGLGVDALFKAIFGL